jgi:hypothetical protein
MKPRNFIQKHMQRTGAGAHRKTNKQLRAKQKRELFQ